MSEYPNVINVPGGKEIQTLCFMTDKKHVRKNFVDLRLLVDDKTVLRNPHKGWFWHYIDNGYGRGNYREAHDENDDLSDFPGLNHLYLRFDWGDVEKAEGVYDFSYLIVNHSPAIVVNGIDIISFRLHQGAKNVAPLKTEVPRQD